MRKIVPRVVAVVVVMMLSLSSCVVDVQQEAVVLDAESTELTLRLSSASSATSAASGSDSPSGPTTRSVTSPGQTAPGTITLSDGHIFIFDYTGTLVSSAPLDPAAFTSGEGQSLGTVPVGSRVFVVANWPTDAPPPTYFTSLDDLRAVTSSIASQTRYDLATLIPRGGRPVEVPSVREATLEVSLTPAVSRLEIGAIEGTGDVRGFTVTAVYLDHYHPRFSLGGSPSGAMIHQTDGWALSGVGDTGRWTASDTGAGWSSSPGEGDVWSFGLAPGQVPGIVVRLEEVNISGTILDRPQLLKIRSFDTSAFGAGVIYRAGTITFDETLDAEVSYLHPHVDAPVALSLVQDAEWFALSPSVPRVKIRAQNPGSWPADVSLRLAVSPDHVQGWNQSTGQFSSAWLPPVSQQTRTVTIPSGATSTITFDVPLPAPGFYRCRVIADDGTILHSFNIGRDPEAIVSPRDAQPDFEEFWRVARAELDAVDPQFKLTYLPEQSNSTRDVYRVTMRSLGGVQIQGIYARPTKEGRHPAIIQYAGYGGGSSSINPNSNPDYAEFHLSTRGQGISTPNTYGEWIAYGIDDPNNHYYRGGFMDLVRAVDFLVSRPEVDSRFIFATGGSQGGAYTLAAAALDDRIAGAAPTVPFLSDYPDYVRITPFVANKVLPRARTLGISQEDLLRTLSYFDVKNLAGWITCPVVMGFGLQDETCPPHTNFAGYNLIASPKQYHAYPQHAHSVGGDWGTIRNNFFESIRAKQQ